MYLKDSPLEHYLKHFILSEGAYGKSSWYSFNADLYNWQSLKPKQLITEIIKHRVDIVDGEHWKEWQNLRTSYEEYLSLNCIAEVTEVTYNSHKSKYSSDLAPMYNHELEQLKCNLYYPTITFNSTIEIKFIIYHRENLDEVYQHLTADIYIDSSLQIPLITGNYATDFGTLNLEVTGAQISMTINEFYKGLPVDFANATSNLHTVFMCHRMVNNYEHRENKTPETFPYDDKYIINRVIARKFQTWHGVYGDDNVISNYFDYANREDKLVHTIAELSTKMNIKK